jgi:hypothetical protein
MRHRGYVRVDSQGRRDVRMSQLLLHGADVGVVFEMRVCEKVSLIVEPCHRHLRLRCERVEGLEQLPWVDRCTDLLSKDEAGILPLLTRKRTLPVLV